MRSKCRFLAKRSAVFFYFIITFALSKSSYTAQNTPSFSASGSHQCQSSTDIGHSCSVSGISFNDCQEAYYSLQRNDCCPSTRTCTTDSNGRQNCRLGGNSIRFTMGACI